MSQTIKITNIPVDKLIPTPDNTRNLKGFEKSEDCKTLADSIKSLGILEPLLIREHPSKKGFYEIRAGERRFRAARVAGLDNVPCIIHDVDDLTAQAVTVTENLHRTNLTPMEEALSVCRLIEHAKPLDEIAITLGKSYQWVARVAKIKNLIPELRAIMAGKSEELSLPWSLMHWLLIARFPENIQKVIFERIGNGYFRSDISHQDLEQQLSSLTKQISLSLWFASDCKLDCPDCASCTNRSGANPGLFDNLKTTYGTEDDLCLDSECWENKEQAFFKKTYTETKALHPNLVLITDAYYSEDKAILTNGTWDRVNKNNEKAIPAMGIDGNHFCKLIYITKVREGRRSSGENTSTPKGEGPKTLQERRNIYHGRRKASIVKKLFDELVAGKTPALPDHDYILRLALAFSCNRKGYEETLKEMSFVIQDKSDNGTLHSEILRQTLPNILKHLRFLQDTKVQNEDEAKCLLTLFGHDFDKDMAQAIIDIPNPKSWDKLNEDGTPKGK